MSIEVKRLEEKMALKKETYPVIGVECASCVRKIETVLMKTDGINNAGVNLASEKLTIEYDDSKVSLEEIGKIVKKIGYELVT
ncbi:MAG: cation transporter [Candidatus Humimicrobiaceae bacterium]